MPERAFTQWSPDTCGCAIEYYNDDGSYKRTVKTCAKHAASDGAAQHLSDVLGHNRQKNSTYQWILDNADTLTIPTRLGPRGEKFLDLVLRYNPNAPVGNDPLIVPVSVIMPNVTPQKIAQLQAAADQRFGAGKILVS
jgi:hypothetical protein